MSSVKIGRRRINGRSRATNRKAKEILRNIEKEGER
jgi:hypothetical protein